jgi:PAS domain S-box-containing protein
MHKSSIRKWFDNVSIARKLYCIVIAMIIMIVFELLSLSFSINVLSSIRAYVNGEGLWTKAQKEASYNLVQYAFTYDQKNYQNFLTFLNINLGDKKARIELNNPDPDYALVTQGFLEGGNNILDIDSMITLYRRFHNVTHMEKVISIWVQADLEISHLQILGLKLNKMIVSKKIDRNKINETLIELNKLNNKLTKLESDFSLALGEASRWMQLLLISVLFAVALTIALSALLFTVLIIRRIKNGIKDIHDAAIKISTGDFYAKIQIDIHDELGYLASKFNKMTASLRQNIIKRKKSERSLVESEKLFKNTFDKAPIGLALVNLDGQFLKVNMYFCSLTGYSEIELIGKHVNDITHPNDVDATNNLFVNLITKSSASKLHLEKRYTDKAGCIKWVKVNTILQNSLEGQPLYFISQIEDITAYKNSEMKIHEQAALLDKSQDAIILKNIDDEILYWNKSAERLYGWKESEVINKRATDFYDQKTDVFVEFKKHLYSKREWLGELKQFRKNGQEIMVQSSWTLILDDLGIPKSILVVNTDITEKKALEEQFYRSQRLDSIGILTTGIAHDLNNIFAPIMILTSLLQMELPEVKKKPILNNLIETSKRGADIVKQLLIFGRGDNGTQITIKLNQFITRALAITKETFPKNITIETNLPDSLWSVSGDSTQLQQVIMNLCVNARDAMPDGGVITIAAENIIIDENYTPRNLDAKYGYYVCIEVSDTGRGIAPEIINKIFDPFFTTKGPESGSGLGLAIIMGITKSHKGFITVDSKLGKGSTFKMFIPALINSSPVEDLVIQYFPLTKGNGELIMIVDDERAIIEGARAILEEFNYKVITAANGLEGLKKYQTRKEEIKVIITDINMPVVDGFNFIKTLFELNSKAVVIVSSGLPISIKKLDISGLNIKSFLYKPYTAENLLDKIQEALVFPPHSALDFLNYLEKNSTH